MKLSIVIPARNEAGNIGSSIDKLRDCLAEAEIPYEIVVVDDGSSDTTPDEVHKRAAIDDKVRLVYNPPPHGFGRAVRRGLDHYSGDAVIIFMADGSDAPEDIIKFYYILREKADCAFGSRWIKGGYVENYPLLKRVINRLANTFIRLLFGIKYNDVTNAFKGYRRYVIDGCRPLISPHFNLTVEIPLKAMVRGYSYEVIPNTWRNRKFGKSSLKLDEMGSRYFYIILITWLEKLLTKGDYVRRDAKVFMPWGQCEGKVDIKDLS